MDTGTGFQNSEWVYLCAARQGVEGNLAGLVNPASNTNYLYLGSSQVISVNPQTSSTGGGYLRYRPGSPGYAAVWGLQTANLLVGASTRVVEMSFPLLDNGFYTSSYFGWAVVVNDNNLAAMQGSAPASSDGNHAVDKLPELGLIDQNAGIVRWRNLAPDAIMPRR